MIESPPGLFLFLKLEDIYHNIPWPHPLRGPQGVSEASGLKHTPFLPISRKNAPDDFGATAWLCTDIPGRDFSG